MFIEMIQDVFGALLLPFVEARRGRSGTTQRNKNLSYKQITSRLAHDEHSLMIGMPFRFYFMSIYCSLIVHSPRLGWEVSSGIAGTFPIEKHVKKLKTRTFSSGHGWQ
jgi:hypothetical protein